MRIEASYSYSGSGRGSPYQEQFRCLSNDGPGLVPEALKPGIKHSYPRSGGRLPQLRKTFFWGDDLDDTVAPVNIKPPIVPVQFESLNRAFKTEGSAFERNSV